MNYFLKVEITAEDFKYSAGIWDSEASPLILACRRQFGDKSVRIIMRKGRNDKFHDGYRLITGSWPYRQHYAVPSLYYNYDLREIMKQAQSGQEVKPLILKLLQIR